MDMTELFSKIKLIGDASKDHSDAA
jgi:hypothetical protein